MPFPTWALVIPMVMGQTTSETPLAGRPRVLLHDVEYARSLRFDASIPPPGESFAPAAIIVHGGGWVRGDRRTNVEPLFKPLADAGIAWFSISYTLATNPMQVGSAVDDVEAAIEFIRAHAAEYRIDADRIVVIGESAGGQLAAMAVLGTPVGRTVKAVVSIYAPTDLVAIAHSSSYIPEGIRKQLNGTPWERLILARLGQLSPIGAVRKDMPPFLFIHGDADPVVPIEQSRSMCERMKEVGASCRMVTVPNGGHGIRHWEDSAAKSEPYKREMVQWIRQQLAVTTEIVSR